MYYIHGKGRRVAVPGRGGEREWGCFRGSSEGVMRVWGSEGKRGGAGKRAEVLGSSEGLI